MFRLTFFIHELAFETPLKRNSTYDICRNIKILKLVPPFHSAKAVGIDSILAQDYCPSLISYGIANVPHDMKYSS